MVSSPDGDFMCCYTVAFMKYGFSGMILLVVRAVILISLFLEKNVRRRCEMLFESTEDGQLSYVLPCPP